MFRVSITERNLCNILDFSRSFPNHSLTGMTYVLIRKQHTARQNVYDFTIKQCKEFTHGFGTITSDAWALNIFLVLIFRTTSLYCSH